MVKSLTGFSVFFLVLALSFPAITTTVMIFNLRPNTSYHVWHNDTYRGWRDTWGYGPGAKGMLYLDDLDLAHGDRLKIVAYEDTTITDVGVIPDNGLRLVTIYPIPTEFKATVDSKIHGTLMLYDVVGHKVTEYQVGIGLTEIDLNLPSGIYYWLLGGFRGKLVIVK